MSWIATERILGYKTFSRPTIIKTLEYKDCIEKVLEYMKHMEESSNSEIRYTGHFVHATCTQIMYQKVNTMARRQPRSSLFSIITLREEKDAATGVQEANGGSEGESPTDKHLHQGTLWIG